MPDKAYTLLTLVRNFKPENVQHYTICPLIRPPGDWLAV